MGAVWLAAGVALAAGARGAAALRRGQAADLRARWLLVTLAFGGLAAAARLAEGAVPPAGAAAQVLLAIGAASLGLLAPASLALAAAARPPAPRLAWTAGAVALAAGMGLLALAFVRVDADALAARGPESGIGLLASAGPRGWAQLWSGGVALAASLSVVASWSEALGEWYRRYVGRPDPGPPASGWLAAAALLLAGSGSLADRFALPGLEWIGQAIAWALLWRAEVLLLSPGGPVPGPAAGRGAAGG